MTEREREANARVRITNQRTGEILEVQADAAGAFLASIVGRERDLLTFVVLDTARNESDLVKVPGDFQVPPDPADVAPPLDPTIATQMDDALEFLWTGDDPIQRDVESDVIEPRRIGWIRGRVIDRDGLPVPGVTVRCLGHDELGWTRTRMDGLFDLVVNGGGTVVLDLERADYLRMQREIHVPWRESVWLEDVMLTGLDPVVTSTDPDSTDFQVHQASPQTDADGTRTATVLFPPGTTATMTTLDGTETSLSTLDVRATEYTVGPNGPKAMPASLPDNVGYTYAVELSVDVARAAGAERVDFSTPLPFFVENFLDFPVGEDVPLGYYDRSEGRWIGYPDGRVVEILSVDGTGRAELDIDGSGNPASASDLLGRLGINDAERTLLASLNHLVPPYGGYKSLALGR